MLTRLMYALAGVLVAAALLGCDAGGPPPVDPAATASAEAADQATISARQPLVQTFTADENGTATAQAGVLARVRPLLPLALQDGGPVTVAGTPLEAVHVTVTNHDQAAHQVVIRLYDRDSPLALSAYSSSDVLAVPAGGATTASVTTRLPFARVATDLEQVDGITDYGPPTGR